MWAVSWLNCCDQLIVVPMLFFFQAEDGIRDWSVTGVQTCALPICSRRSAPRLQSSRRRKRADRRERPVFVLLLAEAVGVRAVGCVDRLFQKIGKVLVRSEERRVGKGCGTRWPADTVNKKRRVM